MRRGILRNWPWKLMSLAAAFLLWLTFSGARELTTAVTVPIQYRNIPKNLEISSDLLEEAHLVLRGPSTRLSRISGPDVPVIIDLSDVAAPGQRTYTLDKRNTSLPPSIVMERAVPAQVRLTFEPRITRHVPVHVRFENTPPGQSVEGFVVEPPTLEIFGPRSSVVRIDRVETDPIDLSQPKPDGKYIVNAFGGDQRINFTGSSAVTVRIRLTQPSANR